MLFNLLTVISTFILLSSAKKCIPGENCELDAVPNPMVMYSVVRDVLGYHVNMMHIVAETAVLMQSAVVAF